MKILFFLSFSLSSFAGTLVNRETGRVVVEFLEDHIQFNDRFLEAEMRETGIYIPSSNRNEFSEKEIIYFGDPLFQKAFVEVYYEYSIANFLYVWQN
jgi:hypothetical protein